MTGAAGICKHFRASQDNTVACVRGNAAGYIQRIADCLGKTVEKRSAARQCNTAFQYVGSQLRRRSFNNGLNAFDQTVDVINQ